MPETPIQTTGVIRAHLEPRVFRVELPNGKLIFGYLPRKLAPLASTLATGDRVPLEMTPYDFEKARIAGPASLPHE